MYTDGRVAAWYAFTEACNAKDPTFAADRAAALARQKTAASRRRVAMEAAQTRINDKMYANMVRQTAHRRDLYMAIQTKRRVAATRIQTHVRQWGASRRMHQFRRAVLWCQSRVQQRQSRKRKRSPEPTSRKRRYPRAGDCIEVKWKMDDGTAQWFHVTVDRLGPRRKGGRRVTVSSDGVREKAYKIWPHPTDGTWRWGEK